MNSYVSLLLRYLFFPVVIILLSSCGEKYQEELAKLVEVYNKVKEPVNLSELTTQSRIETYQNIKSMPNANVWLRHDVSHFNTAIKQSLDSQRGDEGSPLKSAFLETTFLKEQAIVARFRLEGFRSKDSDFEITGTLEVYAVPLLNKGNLSFSVIASDLSLEHLRMINTDFSEEENPLSITLVENTINLLLPYFSKLIPMAKPFEESFTLANINPSELFKGEKCMKSSGSSKSVVADILKSAVVIKPSGIEIIAFAKPRLIDLDESQNNLLNMELNVPTFEMIEEEVESLKTRSFKLEDSVVQEALGKPNYAVVGDFLLSYAFNLLGEELNYSVSGKPCPKPISIDTKIEASKVSEKCKKISKCRRANSDKLKCDSADKCKKNLHCDSGCKALQFDCHARKAFCEAGKGLKIAACYTGKGVEKALCETIKATANTACVALNPDEVLNYPVDCGVAAGLGMDHMGSITGELGTDPQESTFTLERVAATSNLSEIKLFARANINVEVKGNVRITPTGAVGTLLSCTLPTSVKIKKRITLNGNVALNATRTKIEVSEKAITTHYYKLKKSELRSKLDRSILEAIILDNPEFLVACPVASLIGLIDSATGGESGKNTYDIEINEEVFELELQPITWKVDDSEYRIPVIIGSMKSL
ncbi:hypothetical protein FLL45_20850 [Aliikangiella marina]|uniref:DUF4403 family protein n=1 Tax=Aliikangiella marina TaxID=1712262 RepID=A0A545T300_9GAMM|nr:hypothetical protein [Aliikangiella marina]TQV71601.1 hypothetical protein FLL45_20850 [Aliikangiella marina]